MQAVTTLEKTDLLPDYEIPPEGIDERERKQKLEAFNQYIQDKKKTFLGYQINQKMDYQIDTSQFLECHINNLGDPFTPGNFTVNSKKLERAVLNYYAKLWNADVPYDADNPESYWGYVLSMGSTEGNLYALWNARDYLSGKKLMIDKANDKKTSLQYIKPLKDEEDPAYTPVAFFSEDTHYSIIKGMKILDIATYDEIGKKYFPNQNPITENGEWSSSKVPSYQGNEGPGSIDVEKLEELVIFFASKGFPILLVCNFGTTFKGAYDDVKKICDTLLPVFSANGLVDREIEYEDEKGKKHKDIRNGFWIHVDGALGATFVPFLKMANKETNIPEFDFSIPLVNSIVTSGHKWPGTPWPCGLYMSKVKNQLYPPDVPKYIGCPDTTFAGSRNGFSSIILWDYLAKNSYEVQKKKALYCETIARYAVEQLHTLEHFHSDIDLWIDRTDYSLTARFRKPNKDIVDRYSLSCQPLEVNGEVRNYAHIFFMDSVTEDLIDRLVKDLRADDAFKDVEEMNCVGNFGLGWR